MRPILLCLLTCFAVQSQPVRRLIYGDVLQFNNVIAGWNETPVRTLLATDSAGNSYVAGTQLGLRSGKSLSHFPQLFIARIAAGGGAASFSRIIDGLVPTGIAVDESQSIYLTGVDLEGTGFVLKLDAAGNTVFRTSIKASPRGIAVDGSGAIYLTGNARADFPTTPGSMKPVIGEAKCSTRHATEYFTCSDAFIAKLSPDGSRILYATFLGGTRDDFGAAIAVDSSGAAYVVGETQSEDFRTTAGVPQTIYSGTATLGPLSFGDAFAVKIDPSGRSLMYGTYLGGRNADFATGVAVDANQNAYIVGTTRSVDFPVTANAFQKVYGGDRSPMPSRTGDAFFAKLGPAGQGVFVSYIGDTGEDNGSAIALSSPGRGYFSMTIGTGSTCDGFVVIAAFETSTGNVVDRALVPGSGSEATIAVDPRGIVNVASRVTQSILPFILTAPDVPLASNGAYLGRLDFARTDEFAPACLANAASFALNRRSILSIAPGEIVSLFGIGLQGARLRVGDKFFPVLYTSDRQINATVPLDVPLGAATFTVERSNFTASYKVEVAPVFPALFALDGSGRGQAAAVNRDGTVNSAANPAPRGTIVELYGTGLSNRAHEVYISAPTASGAQGMEILYSGRAPGGPVGLDQVNVRIPENTIPGRAFVVLTYPAPLFDQTQRDTFLYVK